MQLPVLHLTPFPPFRSGIADYAASLELAIKQYTDWKIDSVCTEHIQGNSVRDWRHCKRRVQGWLSDGTLERISLVHAEIGYQQHDELYTLYWLRRLAPHVPYVITVHDPPFVTVPAFYYFCLGSTSVHTRHIARTLDYTPMARCRIRGIVNSAAAVVTLTSKGASELARLHKTKDVHVVPHLLLTDPPSHVDSNRKNAPVTVLFMGFWGPSKGLECLVRAMEIVNRALPGRVRLLLTGGADSNPASQRFVDRITALVRNSAIATITEMPGYLAKGRMQPTLDESDIIVMPYRTGLGASASGPLMHGMASGLPAIASDVGAFSEEIRNGVNGYLVPPDNPNALAQAIQSLVKDDAARSRFGLAARASALERHDRRNSAEQFAQIYTSVAASGSD